MMCHSVSPSRQYVAICIATNFGGHYLEQFTLPESEEENTSDRASWYFHNRLNFTAACIEGCITFEDYQKLYQREY